MGNYTIKMTEITHQGDGKINVTVNSENLIDAYTSGELDGLPNNNVRWTCQDYGGKFVSVVEIERSAQMNERKDKMRKTLEARRKRKTALLKGDVEALNIKP